MSCVNAQSGLASTPGGAVPHMLADRFRPSGLFLLQMKPDGSIVFHDPDAGLFFTRYALELLRSADPEAQKLRSSLAAAVADSNVQFSLLPGLSIAFFPTGSRKTVSDLFVLVGKSPCFQLGEDVLRACGRLGIDGLWLNQQAELFPAYGAAALDRQIALLRDMVQDQITLGKLRGELTSLSGELSSAYEELTLIYQLSTGMKVNRQPSDFFRQCCMEVMGVMETQGMGVVLCADSLRGTDPTLYGQISLPPEKLRRLADDMMVELRSRKSALLCNHLNRDKRFGWLGEFASQLLAVPLMREEQVLGCLFALDKLSDEFNTVDVKLLTSIANESAIYLENAVLFDDARGLMMGLLRSLTSAVDAKDAYTCGHSERVALLSRYIAQQSGLTEAMVERVYMAGLLHDVGKIGVPEAVLQKAGRLDPDEYEQIKKHPDIGAHILRDVKQIQDIIPGVLHHHERYDGKGYPAGLAGEQIPLMGRIICLADCFDAMTSSRTYRKALPLEVALHEIRRCSGTQFDPVLADAFLRIRPETLEELLKDHRKQVERFSDIQTVARVA